MDWVRIVEYQLVEEEGDSLGEDEELDVGYVWSAKARKRHRPEEPITAECSYCVRLPCERMRLQEWCPVYLTCP